MTGTQVALLVAYAAIIAVWPVRLIVLAIIMRRQAVLTQIGRASCRERVFNWV